MLEEKANTDTFYVHIFIYTDKEKGLGETFNIIFLFDCSAMKNRQFSYATFKSFGKIALNSLTNSVLF